MISTKRFVAVMMAAILLLSLTYVSVTHATDAQPSKKFTAPGAVVTQTCGQVNSVILTNDDGSLAPFDYTGMTTESLRLYLDKVRQVIIVNAPC